MNPTRRPRTSRGFLIAAAVLILCVGLLWGFPPVGVVLSVGAGAILAPWGRGLGERVIVSTVVAAATVAIIFVVLSAGGWSIAPIGWRFLVTFALVVELGCLRVKRSAPVWPTVRLGDGLGLVAATVLLAALAIPYASASLAHTLSTLLTWWDHSSHLPMFSQVMRAGSWNFASLGSDVMFDVYPMLHVSLWSVGEWAGGIGPATPGLDLVQPYVAWYSLTGALVAALLVWSADLIARALTRGDELGLRRRATPWAAALVAVWALFGTLATMIDFAFVNFLLGSALTISAVAVGMRSEAATRRLGWFTMPLAAIAVAYLYPPMAGGVAVGVAVMLIVVARSRRDRLWPAIALTIVCLAAAVPAIRIITEPFAGRSAGAIQGGIPFVEVWAGIVLPLAVLVVLLRWRRRVGTPVTVALLGPVLTGTAVALLFAAQSLVSGNPLSDSYYTKKILYGLLLLSLPIGAAMAARLVARVSFTANPARSRRQLAVGLALLTACGVAVVAASVLSTSGTSWLPSGIASLQQRVHSLSQPPTSGLVEITAVRNPSNAPWTTVTYLWPTDDPGKWPHGPIVEAGRTTTGIGSLLTWAHSRAIDATAGNVDADTPVELLSRSLAMHPEMSIRVVVPDADMAADLDLVVAEFGPNRVQVIVAQP